MAESNQTQSGQPAPNMQQAVIRHAQNDMSNLGPEPPPAAAATHQPNLGAQFDAWLREGAKDLWNATVPAFPDSRRMTDEPGTPLNPTPQVVTSEMGYGMPNSADRAQYQNQDQDRGMDR